MRVVRTKLVFHCPCYLCVGVSCFKFQYSTDNFVSLLHLMMLNDLLRFEYRFLNAFSLILVTTVTRISDETTVDITLFFSRHRNQVLLFFNYQRVSWNYDPFLHQSKNNHQNPTPLLYSPKYSSLLQKNSWTYTLFPWNNEVNKLLGLYLVKT